MQAKMFKVLLPQS